jgi:hypothetical protein
VSVLARTGGGFGAVADLQLFVHPMEVTFDRADADREPGSDLPIGETGVDQGEHGGLCFRQCDVRVVMAVHKRLFSDVWRRGRLAHHRLW